MAISFKKSVPNKIFSVFLLGVHILLSGCTGDQIVDTPPPEIEIPEPVPEVIIPIENRIVIPYLQINNGEWLNANSANLITGDSLLLGPQCPNTSTWRWNSSDSILASTRELQLDNLQLSQSGAYTVTCEDGAGNVGIEIFHLSISEPEISGQTLFEEQCVGCHGDTGQGNTPLFQRFTDYNGIKNHIVTTMPLENPAACLDDCAEKISDYLVDNFLDTGSKAAITQRLKRFHYYKTIEYLLSPQGITINGLSHPEDPYEDGFFIGNEVDQTLIYSYNQNAIILANRVVQNIKNSPSIINCTTLTETCSQNFYLDLAQRAYRRPLSQEQITRLDSVFSLGQGNPSEGLGYVIGFILQSPSFLYYLNTIDNNSDYSLANQLSFLLWNEPPDAQLLDSASQNRLRNKSEFEFQVNRLLNHSKGNQAIQHYINQWLSLNRVKQIVKDNNSLPNFDNEILSRMDDDLQLFIQEIVSKEKSFENLFSGTYQLSNALQTQMRNFSNTIKPTRQGILTQPGILTFLAGPQLRSPIKRGVYVLDNLLCYHLSPPDNINLDAVLESVESNDGNISLKEKIANATSSPDCMACHAKINPLGFGFENYSGIGLPIPNSETETTIISETSAHKEQKIIFNGLESLQTQLLSSSHFYSCAIDKAFSYANTIDQPSAATLQTIEDSFTSSVDFKDLFRNLAMTLVEK